MIQSSHRDSIFVLLLVESWRAFLSSSCHRIADGKAVRSKAFEANDEIVEVETLGCIYLPLVESTFNLAWVCQD